MQQLRSRSKRKKKLELFQHFLSNTVAPAEYEEALICYYLKITYSELHQQPASWVEQMMTILNQEAKARRIEMDKSKKATT